MLDWSIREQGWLCFLLLLSRTFSAQYLLGIFLGMADGPELRSKPLGGADCSPQLELELELKIIAITYPQCLPITSMTKHLW